MFKPQHIEAKKSLGQHFLTSHVVPGWMCDAAHIAPGDTVLEIGPGTGILTRALLDKGANVIGIEADERAVTALENTFVLEIKSGQLTLHHTDVRTTDLQTIPGLSDRSFKVVANIPYYLSGLLFRIVLEGTVQPQTVIFLVQKEVAKRATTSIASGGKESLLSLSIQAFGQPKYIKTVSRGHFNPPPKVDSAILAIYDIHHERLEGIDIEHFFNILHLGFGQKRKQLLTNLRAQYDRELLVHTFSTITLPETVRAEDVPFEKWLKLTALLPIHTQ